jgi:hypothetical protein
MRNLADLGHELARIAASGTTTKGLAVRRRQREHLAKSVILGLKDLDATLEVGQVGCPTSSEGTLHIASSVGGQIVIALAAALRGRHRWHV